VPCIKKSRKKPIETYLDKMSAKSLFIVFEGIDGSGKTTVSKLVAESLQKKNINVKWHREPTESDSGKQIREFLSGNIQLSRLEQLNLFIKDRKESVSKTIKPSLAAGTTIIQDRYYFSTAAYQGENAEDAEEILERNLSENFPTPDIVYFLDITPEEAKDRRASRGGKKEAFDDEENQERIYGNYLSVLPEEAIFIDATQNLETILSFCLEDIYTRM